MPYYRVQALFMAGVVCNEVVPAGTEVRVRADIIGHARINMQVNVSHAWFKMAD